MTDKFTRKYVADRIEARLGKLKIIEANSQRTIDEWKQEQLAQLDAIFSKNIATFDSVSASVKSAQKAYAKATTWEEKARALAKFENPTFTGAPGIRAYQSNPNWGNNSAESAAKHNLQEARSERVKLEHALIYLNDMPADEFTLTGLKNLGLLAVLKFDINDLPTK